ncbi:NAD(P)-dependent oxidoreductase [Parafilimonas terrae]|uniref:2-hydroxy-3-oxopropionate reductase n=1 Tax=Parafilimonas terrae TaxID=1465490 RepID=A0A1I5XS89_9BACT|nr:NAD(P)-dependent oxidoreductase [Parafilimonas terrae]SFQ34819.1 2-hydroxy-3-oxopropionate reductase [Parafilimonas terrae]
MKEKIGFIGLGIMGKPMARNLVHAGYTLYVFSSGAASVRELEKEGAISASSPKKIAELSDIIITMLPDSPQVKEVAFGNDGLIEGLSKGKLFIDMSTIDAATEIEIHERFAAIGVDTLDAPVSGGDVGAKAGSLSIMAGGSKNAFNRALPLFQILGKRINHIGATGAGQIAKSCNQIATALATQGVIEAFSLAASAGIDLARLKEVLSGGFADSRTLAVSGERMIKRDFSPGFKLKLYTKDLRIAKQAAAERSVNLPGTQLLHNEMQQLVSEGKGELDFSALIHLFENN